MAPDPTYLYPTHHCFDDALDFMAEVLKANPDDRDELCATLILAHGICLAPDGQPYAHAWVEYQDRCIFRGILRGTADYFAVDHAEYYADRHVQEVTRYSVAEAIRENHGAGHYGPWKPAYRALCRNPRERRLLMAETFSDVIRRTSDEDKRKVCGWCAAEGRWDYPVTEVYKGERLTVYCCTAEHQQALQEAMQ